MNTPKIKSALEAMREAGGWYLRKRKRVLPALWKRSAKRGVFAPATAKDVEEWLIVAFPEGYAGYTPRDIRRAADAVIAELRHHDHGLPVLDDASLELVE